MSETSQREKLKPTAPTQAEADALRRRRSLAVSLALLLVLFCGVVMGVMFATHFTEPEAPPDSLELLALRAALEKNPDDVSLKQALHREDLRLRQRYSIHRRRFVIGAWLLLVGVVLAVACVKWYSSLDQRPPRPSTPRERQDTDGWLDRRGRVLMAAGCAAILFVMILVIAGVIGGPRLTDVAAPAGNGDVADNGSAEVKPASHTYKENWPWFRGPTGMGIVKAADWPVAWDAVKGQNVAWKTPVPTPGNSSPVIWGNLVFLTGATAEKQEVFAFDRTTGRQLWRATINPARPPDHECGPLDETGYAAPTAATDGKHVYVTYASADTAAVDFKGKVVWQRNLGNPDNNYGRSTSLLIYQDKLIVQFDRGGSAEDKLSELLALDTRTGKPVWTTPRPVDNSWSTPVLANTPAEVELLTSGDPWVIAYDPDSGVELWRAKGLSDDVAPSPVYANGLVFVTNEYAQIMAIRAGGSGDVTATHVAWTATEGLSDAASPIATDEFFLQANSSGNVTCFEAQSGKLLWEQSFEGVFWASPTLAGDVLYLPAEDGKTYLFKLAREYAPLGAPDLGEPILATPAFTDGQIFIRGKKHLFCITRKTGDR